MCWELPLKALDLHGLAGQQVQPGATRASSALKASVSWASTGKVPQCMGMTCLQPSSLQARAAWRASMVKTPPMGSRATSMG